MHRLQPAFVQPPDRIEKADPSRRLFTSLPLRSAVAQAANQATNCWRREGYHQLPDWLSLASWDMASAASTVRLLISSFWKM